MGDRYYERVANRVRMEMDVRSPRLKQWVIGLLAEAGFTPDKDENWMQTVESVVQYIASNVEEYALAVQELVDPEEEVKEEDKDKNAYEIAKGSYL